MVNLDKYERKEKTSVTKTGLEQVLDAVGSDDQLQTDQR